MPDPTDFDTIPGGPRLQGPTRYPCLVVEASPHPEELGLQFILLSAQVTIGRSTGCKISLKDRDVGQRHATVAVASTPNGPVVTLANLGPGARTHLEGQTLTPNVTGVLRQGDTLRVGNTSLRYGLFELDHRLSHVIHTVIELMRQAQYEEALTGLAALKKYQPIGGPGTTSLERLLMDAKYHEARIHSMLGKWSVADELLSELVECETTSPELRVSATFQMGVMHVHQNDLEQAELSVNQMAQTAQGLDGYYQALALCLRGMTSARQRDFSLAQRSFDAALVALRQSARHTANLSARIRLESAVTSFLVEQHESALHQLNQFKAEDCRGETQRVIYAEALRYRGILHSLRRDYAQAEDLLREALRIFKEKKWRFLEYQAQKSLALNYLSWGRPGAAMVQLQNCQRLLTTDVENEYERAVAAAHLGKVYLTGGDAREALRWFEQEKNLQDGIEGVAHSRAYTHRNFARAHRNLGHHAEATKNYVRSVEIFQEFSNRVQQGLTLAELCKHRLETPEVDAAAEALSQAEESFKAAGRSQSFEPMLDALRAQLAGALGDLPRALALFSSSLRAMESSPPSYLLAETYLAYGRLCAELHRRAIQAQDTSAANEHYQEAKLLFRKGDECATRQNLGYLVEQLRKEIEALDHKEFAKLILSRFVNPEILDQVINSGFRDLNKVQLEERTVIFVDLSGYTALVEREDLPAVRDILNEFYGFATRIIQQHGGAVDKFIGDGVMAAFKGSTGLGIQNQAVAATSAALAIRQEVAHLSERRFSSGYKLETSAGVCTGKLLVGLVGSLEHMNYTCIGDVVNVAARLQGLAHPGEVLIAHETYQAGMQGGAVLWVNGTMREAHVKNRAQAVRYWSLDRVTREPPFTR